MTDNEKKAAIEAEYLQLIRNLAAKNDPLASLGALFIAGEMASAQGIRAEAESIEKIIPATPEPPSVITIENATSVSPVADPIIYLPSLINSGGLTSAVGTTGVTTSGKTTVIGHNFETGADIAVGDVERCGGFYVLGQPRTGKSELLVSMALQDIKNGHGLLFIDPHTEAINKLIARVPGERLKDVVYLDPTENDRTFGINFCIARTIKILGTGKNHRPRTGYICESLGR